VNKELAGNIARQFKNKYRYHEISIGIDLLSGSKNSIINKF